MIIAIDGPAGAGKSTVAKLIAQKLGFLYIDTGAMYRALTLKALNVNILSSDMARIIELARNTAIDLFNNPDGTIKVTLDGVDVSKEIREPRITRYVSDIARIKEVRDVMVSLQRRLGRMGDSVLDGRDIGTVVFPDAERKFYLDANFKERVRRRYKEFLEGSRKISLEEIEEDVLNRDTIDSNREVGPLKKAADAFYIDTTNMSILEVVDILLTRII
ncbi:MAG: (d)CMP kinase [Candidatus Omnitrophota bacterium]|jgi:cytidylate kinase